MPRSMLSMVAVPSILLSSQSYQAKFPTEGGHKDLSGCLSARRHRNLNRSPPHAERRERRHSVGSLHKLEIVKFTGVYSVDPNR